MLDERDVSMADHSNQTWYTIYKAMTVGQLRDERTRIQASRFTDRDARLELIASELAAKDTTHG
jgi:hypothetical protein